MVNILDKGYVKLVERWGSDQLVVESARMSTDKGFLGWENDKKFLGSLISRKHSSPFEVCGATFEIYAPIFVFREWHRHRTQSYNEMSGRYVPLPTDNYIPTLDRLEMVIEEGSGNKQAMGIVPFDPEKASNWLMELDQIYNLLDKFYRSGLEAGIPKEIARITVPVGKYSRMRASANLRNWIGFLDLRLDKSAQWEIRQYAVAVRDILSELFPITFSFIGRVE